ncbi:MAG: redoxin domain-containing protein, partial [Vicinamibacteria bacterium]
TQILGISFDDEADNRAFAEKFHFNFPLLCDTTRDIGMAYGACEDEKAEYAKRISYVIGPEGEILAAYPKVEPAKHPEEILKSLPS